ncbi:GNAT family N-acetyltransferase [Kribbella antibiotica]|uniref:GNAT family N-acetyltransferase n=1 Tax=Kribbella antibiotica TaxID=190195 RepID=A0A4R4YN37_9ACTN|nr:GNAT family N-acetyltransferase [Kribbella antibiotica]TDD44922.1 GNAT family N-acetyltransferase [Kribbella antibiotica]
MMELRELGSDDWKVWRELRLAALEVAPYAFGSKLADWVDAPEEKWRARLELPGSRNAVVYSDGTAVGMASGVPAEVDGVVGLISMWVAPAGRGKGVGDRLMDWVEQGARATGAHTLELMVAEGNEKAIGLYERSGYVATGSQEEVDGDRVLRETIMQKSL